MKKSIPIISLLCFSAFSMVLTGCGQNNIIQSEDKNIVSLTIKEGTLPDEIVAGTFNDVGVTLIVTYSDDSSEEVLVTSSMVQDYINLNTPGTYRVTIAYKGETLSFIVRIVPARTKPLYRVNFHVCQLDLWPSSMESSFVVVASRYVYEGDDVEDPIATLDSKYLESYSNHNIYTLEAAQIHYTYSNWDQPLTNVSSDLDIYAVYNEINFYNVYFYNSGDNGNQLISHQRVDEGDDAVEPTEAERSVDGYTFVGWDSSYLNVSSNRSIYGIYEKVENIPDREVITFGSFPQERVNSSVLSRLLDNVTPNDLGYVTYKGDQYFKSGSNYYKVQPVKWIVLNEADGTKFLTTQSVLYTIKQGYLTVYSNSAIREINEKYDMFQFSDDYEIVQQPYNPNNGENIWINFTQFKTNDLNYFIDKYDRKASMSDYAYDNSDVKGYLTSGNTDYNVNSDNGAATYVSAYDNTLYGLRICLKISN